MGIPKPLSKEQVPAELHKQLEHGPRIRKPESEVICYNAWEFSASD
jgi:hypothetical protein